MTRLARLGLLVASALALGASAPAGALDLVVNAPEDAPDAAIDGSCADAEGRCTLRAAVQESNASVEGDTIQIPAGKLVLKRTGAGENLAATGDLDLTGEVTLTGAGAAVTVIQGKKDRILYVLAGADVTLRGVTLTKGSAGGKGLDDLELSGGAIRNAGSLSSRARPPRPRGRSCRDPRSPGARGEAHPPPRTSRQGRPAGCRRPVPQRERRAGA